MVAWQVAGKRQLAGIKAFSSDRGRGVQGRRKRRPKGAEPWTPCPRSDIGRPDGRVGNRAAKTTDDGGRFDDESR
jgi:hypothetical protein